MAKLSSEVVASLTDRFSGPARSVGNAAERLERQQRSLGRTSRMTARDAAAMSAPGEMFLAGAARFAGPAAAAVGLQKSVVAAADFESALTEIQKKAGISAAETQKLGEEIKALATSGDLAVPISEIAAAYERGAAAGIPVGDLKEFAALSVKAADGFGMSAEQVGNFAAKLKTALGQSNEDVRKTFDLTNSLADAGISDESAIVDYVDRAGASLKGLGLTMPQTLAVGASMLNLGMTSDVAATASEALGRKMQMVGTMTGASRKSFEKVMGPVGKFAKLVEKDANGALLQLLDKVKDLKGEDRAVFLKNFIGDEHSGKVLRLADAVDEYRRNLALANDEAKWFGSLDTSYKLKLNDFWSQWQLVKNALNELAIDTGNMAMPAMKLALETAKGLIGEIDQGLAGFRARIDMTELQQAMAGVQALGGEISRIMQLDVSKSPVGRFFDRLTTATDMVSGAINMGVDAAQAVGIIEDDGDTAEQKSARRKKLLDDGRKFSPPIDYVAGKAEQYGEWAGRGAERDNPQADEDRMRGMDDFMRGDGLSTPERSPAAEKAYRYKGRGTMRLPELAYPTAVPREFRNPVTVPTPRPPSPREFVGPMQPNIAGAVTAQADEAVRAAEAAGQRIGAAFSITAAPQIDMTGANSAIDSAISRLSQLDRALERFNAKVRNSQQSFINRYPDDGFATRRLPGTAFDDVPADIEN